jgi:hypothetical protein
MGNAPVNIKALKTLIGKLLLHVWLLIPIIYGSVSTACAEQWLYRNPLHPEQLFSIETKPDSFGIDDVRFEAEFCSVTSEFICIKSSRFQFYVPKNLSESKRIWMVNGLTYVVKSSSAISLLGMEDYIYFIDRSDKGEGEGTFRFLYSKHHGLIGMGGFTDNSSAIFLLDVSCGFGAAPDCSK